MALKSYEDGMDNAAGELNERSEFALNHSTGEDTLSGKTMTGIFVPVDLSVTNPINLEKGGDDRKFDGKDEMNEPDR